MKNRLRHFYPRKLHAVQEAIDRIENRKKLRQKLKDDVSQQLLNSKIEYTRSMSMTKEESLEFLQSCIDKVNNSSEEEIAFYKEIIEREYTHRTYEGIPEFEFVPPVNLNCD